MTEGIPSPKDLADRAWEKAMTGEGLTPSESQALQVARGVFVQPTLPEPTAPLVPPGETPTEHAAAMTLDTAADIRKNLGHLDVRDLVTGETVINLSVRDTTSEDRLRISPDDIETLPVLYKAGKGGNIRLLVDELDRAVVPGFKRLFTADEIATLDMASPALLRKVHMEIMRVFEADNTERMIATVDRGIESLIVPCLKNVQNQHARASISACIDIWRANKKNPYANFYRRTARNAEKNPLVHSEYATPLLQMDPRYFSVGKLQNEPHLQNVGAGFSNMIQVMFVRKPEEGKEMNFLELLSVMHELTHKKYQAELVRHLGVGSAAYEACSKNLPTLHALGIMDEDPEAIGNEIELLIAKTGYGELTVEKVASMLGVTSDRDKHSIHELFLYAQTYFPTGRGAKGEMPPAFVKYFEAEYRRLGARIFEKNEKGIFVEKL